MALEAVARERYLHRGQRYHLSERQARVLRDVGAFRVIHARDVADLIYDRDVHLANRELKHLRAQGLVIDVRRAVPAVKRWRARYVTLTPAGRSLVRGRLRQAREQAVYAGIKKWREVRHDAALYRMAQRATREIEAKGGKVRRVILDYELKRALNRDLERLGRAKNDTRRAALERIAQRHELVVVDDAIPLPDVRLEYEVEGHRCHLDLEYVTANYRGRMVAQKAAAGFTLYGPRGMKAPGIYSPGVSTGNSPRSRRPRWEPSLAADILAI